MQKNIKANTIQGARIYLAHAKLANPIKNVEISDRPKLVRIDVAPLTLTWSGPPVLTDEGVTNAVAFAKNSDVAVVVSRFGFTVPLIVPVVIGTILSNIEFVVVAAAPSVGVNTALRMDVVVVDGASGLMKTPSISSSARLEKLPQAMRERFAKCSTNERLPKKAPIPSLRETKGSVNDALKVVWSSLPCLPPRSPTWQVSGREASQGVTSPLMKGSRWASVELQLPSDATGSTWMWYASGIGSV